MNVKFKIFSVLLIMGLLTIPLICASETSKGEGIFMKITDFFKKLFGKGLTGHTVRDVSFGWNAGYSFDDTYRVAVPSDYLGCKVKIAPHEGSDCSVYCDISVSVGSCTDSYECVVNANPGNTIDATFSANDDCGSCLWDYDIYKYAWCGDGYQGTHSGYNLGTCVDGQITTENCENCPEDYPTSSGEVCCSGIIFNGDCCSDSDCSSSETCESHDCTSSAPSSYCGDGNCDSDETCSSCSSDCGSCQTTLKSDGETCSLHSECESEWCGGGGVCCESGEDCCNYDSDCSIGYECGSSDYCVSSSTTTSLKTNGQSCSSNSECSSGNCYNYLCCSSGKTCCDSDYDCYSELGSGNECGSNYYCVEETDTTTTSTTGLKSKGEVCYSNDECESGNCNFNGLPIDKFGDGYCCQNGKDCCENVGSKTTSSEGVFSCNSDYYLVTYEEDSSTTSTESVDITGICTFAGSYQDYGNCLLDIASEKFPIADVASNILDGYCDVFIKLIDAILSVDTSNEASIRAARVKINEATTKVVFIFVDLADNFWFALKIPGLILDGIECIDDLGGGLSGKVLDYIVEGIAEGLFESSGISSASVLAHSPINLQIEDGDGNKFGGGFQDIPSATYKYFKNSDTTVIIAANVEPDKVIFRATGTGPGNADLVIITIDEKGKKNYREFNDLKIEKGTEISVSGEIASIESIRGGVEHRDDIEPNVIEIEKLSQSKTSLKSLGSGIVWIIVILIIVVLGFIGYKNKDRFLGRLKSVSNKKIE